MALLLTLLTVIIPLIMHGVIGERPPRWDYDVYTGRHFDTLVTSLKNINNVVVKPSLLILYQPECSADAQAMRDMVRPWGPMDKYLTVAWHDYATFPKHIWFKFDERDDMARRYILPTDSCMKILYFAEGSRLSDPEVWTGIPPLYDWIWNKFLIDVEIYNHLDQSIVVKKEGQGKPYTMTNMDPGTSYTAETHLGLAVTISDTNESLLYAIWLEPHHRYLHLHITDELVKNFQEKLGLATALKWQMDQRNLKIEESEEVRNVQWQIAESYLLTFKQPIVLPHFTETGYLKTTIPAEVYSTLKAFYDTTKASQGVAEEDAVGININNVEIKTGIVQLSQEVKSYVHEALLNQMQEWCQCELHETAFYGIREYYKGNNLRMHVDRVETHVISSILQIDQDLGDANEDWLLEIIDFDGDRLNVTLYPGEMLLYESATLIHGRPVPFQGNYFANCFLHYQPTPEWPWVRSHSGASNTLTNNDGIVESLDVIRTPFSFSYKQKMLRDEL